jgi:hypothetical protein
MTSSHADDKIFKHNKIIEGGEGRGGEKIWEDLEVALTEFSL